MEWMALVVLTLLIIASTAARAWQEATVGWDPVSCWDCTTTADYVAPIIWGYLIGAVVGVSGILRRRYRKLKPETVHILDI